MESYMYKYSILLLIEMYSSMQKANCYLKEDYMRYRK